MLQRGENMNEENEMLVDENEEVAYTLKLSNFEGPFDLLLHLISEAKIQIEDIFVSEITSQYLKYMEQIYEIDLEAASTFLSMAATLLERKSKMLFLNEGEDGEMQLDDEEGDDIIRRLNEYKVFKEVSEILKDIENTDRFYKAPDKSLEEVQCIYNDFNLNGLLDAFTKVLERVTLKEKEKKVNSKEIPKETYKVSDRIKFVLDTVKDRKELKFTELFEEDKQSRSLVIVTFQALLELLKRQYMFVSQEETYGEIILRINDDNNEEINIEELSEYN